MTLSDINICILHTVQRLSWAHLPAVNEHKFNSFLQSVDTYILQYLTKGRDTAKQTFGGHKSILLQRLNGYPPGMTLTLTMTTGSTDAAQMVLMHLLLVHIQAEAARSVPHADLLPSLGLQNSLQV